MFTNVDLEPRFGTTVLQSPFGLGAIPTTVSKHVLSFLRFADPKNDWAEAFYPLAREQADLFPWNPKTKNVTGGRASEKVASYDDIIAGPKGVRSNEISQELRTAAAAEESKRMTLSAKTMLSGMYVSVEGEENSLDTRVKQRENAKDNGDADAASSIGGTETPDDVSVSSATSTKSTVSKFSQKVMGALLVNLSMEERKTFMDTQGLTLSDYEVFIPEEERPQDHLDDESLTSGGAGEES